MVDTSKKTYEAEVLPQLATSFDLPVGALAIIQDRRNFVYRSTTSTGEVIFKVLPSPESRHCQLLGEMDWVAHLGSNGVVVPEPCRSRDGNLVESLVFDGLHYSACCFRKVEGRLWQECPRQGEMLGPLGRLAGKMHRVSVGYSPQAPGGKLPTWSDMPWFKSPEEAIHPSMPGVIERCIALREALSRLPAIDQCPVHDDLHGGNVLVSPTGPVAIDFECAHYASPVAEIASALFFWVWKTPLSQPSVSTRRAADFLAAFMGGYAQEHTLDRTWTASLPLFLKARELSMLASSPCAREDFASVGRHDIEFSWRKSTFEKDVPFVELDLSRWGDPGGRFTEVGLGEEPTC
jgi:Ser/Thr protein kinase RdoA (MazF antagonist)